MSTDRRQFLKIAAGVTALSLADIPYLEAAPRVPNLSSETPVNIIVPRDYDPIKIETPHGRAQYEREQRKISELASPLRSELRAQLERVLALHQAAASC